MDGRRWTRTQGSCCSWCQWRGNVDLKLLFAFTRCPSQVLFLSSVTQARWQDERELRLVVLYRRSNIPTDAYAGGCHVKTDSGSTFLDIAVCTHPSQHLFTNTEIYIDLQLISRALHERPAHLDLLIYLISHFPVS